MEGLVGHVAADRLGNLVPSLAPARQRCREGARLGHEIAVELVAQLVPRAAIYRGKAGGNGEDEDRGDPERQTCA